MRVPLSLLVLTFVGCGGHSGSLDAEYRSARSLLQAEQYSLALTKAEDGLRKAERQRNSAVGWQFRLLKAEVLLGQRQAASAAAVLSSDPPDGPAWAEDRGWRLLLTGRAAFYQAHYAEAQEQFDRAAELARQTGSASLATEVELRRALLLVGQARFDAAEATLRHVIDAASALGETYLEAVGTGNLGYTLLNASKYDEAITWFERARELHTRLGANESIARDDGNLGWCYHRLGNYENAQSYYERARAGFAKTGNHFEEQIWLGATGTLLYDTYNYAPAVEAYRRAYEIARSVQNAEWAGRWASSLASVLAQLSDWVRAEQYNNEALALEGRLHVSPFGSLALSTAGRIAVGRRHFAEAEQLFREAMNRPARDPRFKLIAQTELARLYYSTGKPRHAEAEFHATVSSIDRLNAGLIKDDYKFGYLSSLIEFYRIYIDFLIANHQPERALQVAESSRSHVLAQRSGRAAPAQSVTAGGYQNLARLAKAVLLEYWLGENQSYLWVITPHRIRNYVLPPAKSIHGLVEAYRNVVLSGRNPLESSADTGRKLYDTLLAPAAKDLCAGCRVLIVPDQDLYALNFETLPDGRDTDQFWIEKANVEIAPSLDYLVDTRRRPHAQAGSGLLVMGDPAPVLEEYPKLEFAAREIDDICSTMGGSDPRVLRGPEARPDSYAGTQPGRFEYIHFSAHAEANTQSPLDSAVILSGPPDRCKLFARDVMSVPLTAELVTISACRSAGAKTYAGEGPVGFAWAFLRAGARNVIAGLWDVNDRSTAQLMSRLYGEIARGSTPAYALRAAKLALIGGGGAYAKPYYWAPFQLYAGAP
jgi:CHAT domain-containing protein/predicted negative regulator of RcsB-dependent stress response